MVASLHTTQPLKNTSSAASTLRPTGCSRRKQHKDAGTHKTVEQQPKDIRLTKCCL
jgi:hypothetical protein